MRTALGPPSARPVRDPGGRKRQGVAVEPEYKAAYDRLAEAIRDVSNLEGAEGVITEWVVVSAHQHYDDDGQQQTQIGQWMPGGDPVPYHRVMGLLDYALTLRRAEIGQA
jgi:hypothetical protein